MYRYQLLLVQILRTVQPDVFLNTGMETPLFVNLFYSSGALLEASFQKFLEWKSSSKLYPIFKTKKSLDKILYLPLLPLKCVYCATIQY